jgi:lipopolysaccharide export system protein LptC
LKRRSAILLDRLIAWAPVLLLGSLAALTFWLDSQIQEQQRREGSARHDPDTFVNSFRAVSFDTDGRLRQALAAKRAQHYPDDDSMDFIEPLLVLTDPDKPRISVTASKGALSGDHETITLTGNVRALRDAPTPTATPPRPVSKKRPVKNAPIVDGDAPNGPVTITTEYLRVVPKQGRADTDKAVTIEEPRGIINAVGMELDNKAKTLKLKSRVHGTLAPPAKR